MMVLTTVLLVIHQTVILAVILAFAQNAHQLILIVPQMTLVIVPIQQLFGKVQQINVLQLQLAPIQSSTLEIIFVRIVQQIAKIVKTVYMILQECV